MWAFGGEGGDCLGQFGLDFDFDRLSTAFVRVNWHDMTGKGLQRKRKMSRKKQVLCSCGTDGSPSCQDCGGKKHQN